MYRIPVSTMLCCDVPPVMRSRTVTRASRNRLGPRVSNRMLPDLLWSGGSVRKDARLKVIDWFGNNRIHSVITPRCGGWDGTSSERTQRVCRPEVFFRLRTLECWGPTFQESWPSLDWAAACRDEMKTTRTMVFRVLCMQIRIWSPYSFCFWRRVPPEPTSFAAKCQHIICTSQERTGSSRGHSGCVPRGRRSFCPRISERPTEGAEARPAESWSRMGSTVHSRLRDELSRETSLAAQDEAFQFLKAVAQFGDFFFQSLQACDVRWGGRVVIGCSGKVGGAV